jgi:hypothetical protein
VRKYRKQGWRLKCSSLSARKLKRHYRKTSDIQRRYSIASPIVFLCLITLGDIYISTCRNLSWQGKTRDEIIGKSLWELFPDLVGTYLEKRFRHAMENNVQEVFEYYYEPYDIWMEYRLYPTPDGLLEFVTEISERKKAEEILAKIEEARIKEIRHRIKNNLQVISSLLDLQVEAFPHLETCNVSKVIDAFKDSQNRVAPMALIHEELYRSKGTDSLDFTAYIQKLTQELFSSYNLRNEDISLKMNLEQAYLGMDTAIPLGIVANELVSNSLKYAFPDGKK